MTYVIIYSYDSGVNWFIHDIGNDRDAIMEQYHAVAKAHPDLTYEVKNIDVHLWNAVQNWRE